MRAHIVPNATVIAGIEIPSTSPVFLGVVGFHVLVGLACVVTGAGAMLSREAPGRHPNNRARSHKALYGKRRATVTEISLLLTSCYLGKCSRLADTSWPETVRKND